MTELYKELDFGRSEDGCKNILYKGTEIWKAKDWQTEIEAENSANDEIDFILEIGIDEYLKLA